MTEQRRKLMIMLGTAVDNLDRLDVLVPQLRQLGRRHVAYGVTPSSYDTVGAALLSALEIGLADAFTPQVRAAWAACYTMIATTMNAAGDTSHAAGASPA
jgi:hemoglobin-like flavoprotein